MKILIDDKSYEGSAIDIIEKIKEDNIYGDETPDTASFLEYMRETFTRMTDFPCHLDGSMEERASGMLKALEAIDAITVLEE